MPAFPRNMSLWTARGPLVMGSPRTVHWLVDLVGYSSNIQSWEDRNFVKDWETLRYGDILNRK